MRKERNYGIDLLRLVLMYMVCVLHTLRIGGILDASKAGTAGYGAFWFLEILSFCAVDGFALISGYTASEKPRDTSKIVNMWFQVFFYSFILTVLLTVLKGNESLSVMEAIKLALPVTFGQYWYFTAYFILFFAMPMLNRFLFSITEDTAKKGFLLLVILFSVLGIIADPFRTQWGYSAIWLIALYCIGVLAKRIRLFETKKTAVLLIGLLLCTAVTWAVYVFAGNGRLVNYNAPTVLLSGLILVVLFSRLQLRGTVISKLSPLAFGIYLFQLSPAIREHVLKDAFAFVAGESAVIGVFYVLAFALAIFAVGLAVEFIRSLFAKLLHIPSLSSGIVSLADRILTKLGVLLK